MTPDTRIYVAAHSRLAGSGADSRPAWPRLRNLVVRTDAQLELIDARAVGLFFALERPDVVCLARS